jgi:cytochrome c-type biogenesis protein
MNLHEPSLAVAFTLGLWTAIQPCPLTANLAAVAWLGRRVGSTAGGILAAALFVAGQVMTYVALAWLVLQGIAASWRLSALLQQHVNELLGPVWIIAAMVLLGLIQFRLPRLGFRGYAPPLPAGENVSGTLRVPPAIGTRSVPDTIWTAFPLGIMLALAFCPVTAVLFFVNLLTIATAGGSHIVYPVLYALGAALPVAVFAVLLQAGSHWFGSLVSRTQQVQRWLNRAAGGGLLLIGTYSCLRFNFALLPF